MISDVLNAVYTLLDTGKPTGIKRVFDPGQPFGPFRQNLPAIVILPSPESLERVYESRDICEDTLQVEINILVEDPFTRIEARERGDASALVSYTEAVIALLEGDRDLGGKVDELLRMSAGILGPHATIVAEYSNQAAT